MSGETDFGGDETDMDNRPDMKVDLAGTELRNPVMPASGTFGYGQEYKDFFDLSLLGALVTKSVTWEPRYGNPLPRIAECSQGMMNSIGLQNPGIENYLEEALPLLRESYYGPVISNISGSSPEEYGRLARAIDGQEQVVALEVNISCPNVKDGGAAFGADPEVSRKITEEVKKNTSLPVFMKLTPNVTDITVIARACEEGGADGISLINNFKALKIDLKTRKPVTAMKYAGLSGPAIKPIALRMVNEVFHAVNIPVIGIGGVSTADDVLEMIMAGATAVQVGSANLVDPWACPEIIKALPVRMEELGIESLDEIRGVI